MKTHLGAIVGSAIVLTLVAVSLYQSWDWFVSDEAAGSQGYPADPDVSVILRSIEAKNQVADEVIAGRMTLVVAVARFQTINASRPAHLRVHFEEYPGRTDEERIGRRVISYVRNKLDDRPNRDAVIGRLESEFQAHLASDRSTSRPVAPVGAARASD